MRVRLLVAAVAALSTTALASPAGSAPAPPPDSVARRAGSVIGLGQALAPNAACLANSTTAQTQVASGPGYVTPIAGVITSISYYANSTPGNIRLVFLRPGVLAGHYDSTGYHRALAAAANVLNVFPTRIKIGSGVILALHTDAAGMGCWSTGFAANDTIATDAFDPVLGTDFGPGLTVASSRLDLSVTMEADADNDGYGDVTQDLCPESDLTHGSCANVTQPDTTLTKKPAKRGTKRTVKATFTSTVAGATFECSLDQRPFRRCTSPYKKKVGYGRHILEVQAVGPAGLVDLSPASVKFRVIRPPR